MSLNYLLYRHQISLVRATQSTTPEGRIVQSWRKLKVAGHADAVLDALKAAQAQ